MITTTAIITPIFTPLPRGAGGAPPAAAINLSTENILDIS